ncbi:2-succinyl-5-enolpyruvyl-6-hydroxy-3-cyclohexene-1-carboxylic-acid synthase [Nesterenkonia alba]|uniref:2-succinyl-5-enolpyruvyl-6-hydroxy-3- cyclohexene-1-carboxylic-acid synthase n=1 Tax=Nesterenkonia alba TaxID=515814 RepID=UPI0003B30933|nr:2-succinyl-5-enolpyruvyl-6-hydroxy-3-cyclohexene-1-carboxylic-acid synthase [Nesterenkonia alba]
MRSRRGFREFDDSHDAESLRLARRVIRGLSIRMRQVVLAPGSRSAPLAYALAEAEQLGAITLYVRIDERSAAFTALGLAMQTGEPAAVVTTSGTAAGNLTPAIMEADMAGVPLVAITADRPEPLHGTGANQTTWQQGMFSGRVRDELHLEQGQVRLEPESRDDILAAETQTALLLAAATRSTPKSAPGPVHLNIGFADPLVPAEAPDVHRSAQRWARRGILGEQDRARLYAAARGTTPAEHLRAGELSSGELRAGELSEDLVAAPAGENGAEELRRRRTLFVFGDRAPAEAIDAARSLGHPMLAEPTSGARWSDLGAVQAYRLLLQAPAETTAGQLAAGVERVVVAGRPTLTRPVQRLIARADVQTVQYAPVAEAWWTPGRLPRRLLTTPEELEDFAGTAETAWARQWEELGLAAQRAVDSVLQAEASLSSVRAAQFVAETVRTPLLLGSSSVIRDVDLTAVLTRAQTSEWRSIRALRGLAGIDGNLSAASGMALAAGQRVTALVGDLTLLHDANALLVPTTESPVSVDVVVINDGGGAIFDQLEHGDVGRRPGQAEIVERLFGTPQAVDVEALADAYHVDYRAAETLEELADGLAHPDDRIGVRLIEVRTERSELRQLHARILQAAAEL